MDQLDEPPVTFASKEQAEADLDDLREAVLASAAEARRAFFMFGAFTLYLIITVGTTTHEQLLRGSTFELPILNVSIPLIGFYIVVPVLFFLAHLNLLGELNSLSENAEKLKRARDEQKSYRHPPFPYGIARVFFQPPKARAPRQFIVFVVIMSAVVIPPFVLLAVQGRLLAYHGDGITWLHRLLVTADVIALWLLWPKSKRTKAAGSWSSEPLARLRSINWYRALAAPATILMIAVSSFVVTIPEEWVERRFVDFSHQFSLIKPSLAADHADQDVTDVCSFAPWHAFKVVYVGSQHRFHHDRSRGDRAVPCWTFLLFEGPDSIVGLRRNLIVSNRDLVAVRPMPELVRDKGREALKSVWEDVGQGLDLRGRDLRFADLAYSDLRKADFRGADLTGARFTHTRLDYAQFRDIAKADLGTCRSNLEDKGYRTCRTRLQDVNFKSANLSFTSFYKADLKGANLHWAILYQSSLAHAELADVTWLHASLEETAGIRESDHCMLKRAGAKKEDLKSFCGCGLPPPVTGKKTSACSTSYDAFDVSN